MRVDVGKPGLIMPGAAGFPLHPRDSISITLQLQDLLTPGCCVTAHVWCISLSHHYLRTSLHKRQNSVEASAKILYAKNTEFVVINIQSGPK